MRLTPALFLALLPGITGCDSPVSSSDASPQRFMHITAPTVAASGGGHLTVGGALDVQFAFNARNVDGDSRAIGNAHHSVLVGGELVEFFTTVTCLTVDPTNDRAWIGGIIRENNSTHPAWTGLIHQPGKDIWFRVVDYGEGSNAPRQDRSTFVGFEGAAGIITSEEYCDTQPWPANDAGTNPVTSGNVQVLD